MRVILNLLIFCLVLFIYLHVYYHIKTSKDLEVYEIEQPSKDKLEEICDLRQPVIFDYPNERLLQSCKRNVIQDTYGAFDIKIRNVRKDIDDEEDDKAHEERGSGDCGLWHLVRLDQQFLRHQVDERDGSKA